MKCMKCYYYSKAEYYDAICGHEKGICADTYSGTVYWTLKYMRSASGPCGPDARLWEGKNVTTNS